ncbi:MULTISPECIES: hypothetical protein [unclassified Synechococcus]|uniref:hypothetical protein n=1 Tax=unclassified Synechococcus TaxID=2626047 RepID=UPI001F075506|nr:MULTISPECIES: hypothetical protein [unclassified Synechococcus]
MTRGAKSFSTHPVAPTLVTIKIEWQDQHGRWQHLQTKQNQADAYRIAMRRAESSGERHRLVDDSGRLLELLAA